MPEAPNYAYSFSHFLIYPILGVKSNTTQIMRDTNMRECPFPLCQAEASLFVFVFLIMFMNYTGKTLEKSDSLPMKPFHMQKGGVLEQRLAIYSVRS